MITTLYIVFSLLHYFLDDYPSYKHFKDNAYLYGENAGFSKFGKIIFYILTANVVICFVLIVFKCIGILEWW